MQESQIGLISISFRATIGDAILRPNSGPFLKNFPLHPFRPHIILPLSHLTPPSSTLPIMSRTTPKAPSTSASKPPKKKFAEDNGLAHLLSLSQSITDAKTESLNARIEKNKSRLAAVQQKKKQEQARKQEKTGTMKDVHRAKTKAEIKKDLKASQRDRAKKRKENRKKEHKVAEQGSIPEQTTMKKSVSFALS